MASNKMPDYYFILQVGRNATKKEIEENYRKILLECRPTKSDVKLSPDIIKQMNIWADLAREAYFTLINDNKRRRYDIAFDKYLAKEQERKEKEAAEKRKRGAHVAEKSTTTSNKKYQGAHVKPQSDTSHVNDGSAISYGSHRMRHEAEKESSYKEMMFNLGNGVVRICEDSLERLSKMKFKEKESFLEYLSRNREIVGVILTAAMVMALHSPKTEFNPTDFTQPVEIVSELEEEQEKTYTLNFYHRIEPGEYLAIYSDNSNSSIPDIMAANGLTSTEIYAGHIIKIPYVIQEEDLPLYTKSIRCNETVLTESFAKDYQTDLETLVTLNQDYMERKTDLNGKFAGYTCKSPVIDVPNFLTANEYREMKGESSVSFFK